MTEPLNQLVRKAQAGDLDAFEALVRSTQKMAYAVAKSVLRDSALAEDAAQESFLRAYRRLADLEEPAGFISWLRRIVVTVALNARRSRRHTFLHLDDGSDVPVLDEIESAWSEEQRRRLGAALLTLTDAERRLCDLHYHGRWSAGRLARDAGVSEAAMRKRLQRIRDRLRKEIEVSEQRDVGADEVAPEFPARIVELLARPNLATIPDNPVGKVVDLLRGVFDGYREITLPELIDFDDARKSIGEEALYIEANELHRVDGERILRYDLTLPLLLTVRYDGEPLRLWTAGKAYRLGRIDRMHLEAFHQAEVFLMDDRDRVDPWMLTAQVLRSVEALLPQRTVKIVPTHYDMCTQAWELEVEDDGRWAEVLAWGIYSDRMVRHLGGDPERHVAMGIGYGLERFAMLRYAIDDIRKVDVTHVA
ncbi:MAG: sigma-70 family RNA polymerase sigma factor [Vicinamibacterales bacterium]